MMNPHQSHLNCKNGAALAQARVGSDFRPPSPTWNGTLRFREGRFVGTRRRHFRRAAFLAYNCTRPNRENGAGGLYRSSGGARRGAPETRKRGALSQSRQHDSHRLASVSGFEEMVERHSGMVYNVALRMMGNPQDAEDVAQDAFLSAYRAYSRFEGRAKISTWLYRITVNAALMRLRKEKRAKTLTRTGLDDIEIADWSAAPDGFAANSELGDKIMEGLDALPPDMKAAVVLRDVQGLSGAEAAEALQITVSSLKSRLHRGRTLIRKHMDEYLKSKG